MSYRVRRAVAGDVDRLVEFFAAAYGPTSVFTEPRFLRWFLGDSDGGFQSIVALDEDTVVAHYGWLEQRTSFGAGGPELPLRWGVNAYTLPAHRGRGLGTQVIDPVLALPGVFGVIGFSEKTAEFYEQQGFNVFGRARMTRWVRLLGDRWVDAARLVGAPDERIAELRDAVRPVPAADAPPALPTGASLPPEPGLLSAVRDDDYLTWRFRSGPLPYDLQGHREGLIVSRRIRLEPSDVHVTRIVDLFGAGVEPLLDGLIAQADARRDAYLELSQLGTRHADQLSARGFVPLRDADAELLPYVFSPVQRRPNHEYVGVCSADAALRAQLQQLRLSDVYFTSADSDRDRAARVGPHLWTRAA